MQEVGRNVRGQRKADVLWGKTERIVLQPKMYTRIVLAVGAKMGGAMIDGHAHLNEISDIDGKNTVSLAILVQPHCGGTAPCGCNLICFRSADSSAR